MADTIGLRELRQHASDVIRRVEAGEEIEVTVAGRLAARISPIAQRRWRKGSEVAAIFDTPVDPTWADDLRRTDELIDQQPSNPWDR